MRVVVVGATGNVGTSLLEALAREPQVESVLGVARRLPDAAFAKTDWARADIATDDLVPLFRGAAAVVHLAWVIQPSHDAAFLRRVNVEGSARLFEAVVQAGVPALVYASSVGAYAPGPKDRRVDESWPLEAVPTSFYARHKVEVERRLDAIERRAPALRVVRMRPGFIFKREAASGIRRLWTGPLLPSRLVRRALIPLVPQFRGLRFQAVHSHDVGEAYRLAIVRDVRGPFNLAAEPPLDADELGRTLDARPLPVPPGLVRGVMDATWRLRLQPTPPGWLDLGRAVPLLSTERARTELGWEPRRSAVEAVLDLLDGIQARAGIETPPLARTSCETVASAPTRLYGKLDSANDQGGGDAVG
ncbi:MAG: NAD-dependent epimerase/dehydratase family protein [Thermoleophilia bacterium]|nr:NAD-dependent epimerase/dehydratase family protein [Thermoleophilia bacterium]